MFANVPQGGGFGGNGGGFGGGGGPGGNPGGNFGGVPSHMAAAHQARAKYMKAYRMSFCQVRSDADPLTFLFLQPGIIINEIWQVTGVLVQISDIMSQRQITRN